MELHQVDCFRINMRFWKCLAIWPDNDSSRRYNFYSKAFITTFVLVYNLLFTINFYFLPRQLDIFIEEMIFYFTEVALLSKVLTFVFMRNKITEVLNILESEIFQADDAEGLAIIEKAKKFNRTYWKIVAFVSCTSCMTLQSSMINHIIMGTELKLPVSRYSFLSDEFRNMLIYPLFMYQGLGITFHMLYNVNIDTFFLGLMVLIISQLDILDKKLRKVTDQEESKKTLRKRTDKNEESIAKINQCIIQFSEVSRFCRLVQEVFSGTLFVQFSMASCIICVCLMRFTMPAPLQYLIFLATYMIAMILQIMVPCWFGTRIMDKSNLLAFSIYNCDWTSRSRQFKRNMRLFVERANKPLSITGGKMFCLSLTTFTSIMNSAYSFFTLLRHMQSQK